MTPELAPPSPNYQTALSGGRLRLDIFNVYQPPLHSGSSAARGSNLRHTGHESVTLTTRLPRLQHSTNDTFLDLNTNDIIQIVTREFGKWVP
ncbi:hypothetical protein TNCV_369631 [Trichonephila clavipes]|nr:hypothetical protein TNCV_369631 [Trichonephila clavipes]